MKAFRNLQKQQEQQERSRRIQMFDELAFSPNKNKSKLPRTDDSSSITSGISSSASSVSSKFLLKKRLPKQKTIDLLKPYADPSYKSVPSYNRFLIGDSVEDSRINNLSNSIRELASSIINQKQERWQNPYVDALAKKLKAIADLPVSFIQVGRGVVHIPEMRPNFSQVLEKQKQFSALKQSEEYKAVFGTPQQVKEQYSIISPRIKVQRKREEVYDKPRIAVGRAIATLRGGDPWGKESENKSTSDIAHQSFDFFGNILTKKEAPGLNFSDLKNNSLAEAYNSLRKLGIADMFGNLRTSSESKIDIYNQGLFPAIKTLKNSLKRVRGRRDVR